MDDTQLILAQTAQLCIAREVKRICDKNGIRYSLAFGTMIGAVRHGGFIPWDDDLDLAMCREDYDRFVTCCETDLSPDFLLQTMDSDPKYGWPFLKIRLKGTRFRSEWDNHTSIDGIWIDVFPVDVAPRSALLLKMMNIKYKYYLRMLHIKLGISGYLERGFVKRGLRKLLERQGYKHTVVEIKNKIQSICTKYSYSTEYQSDWLFAADALYSRLPAGVFAEYTEVPFSGESFSMVRQYDSWLRIEYGDYMKLPPREDRENRHKIVDFFIPRDLIKQ